MLQVNHYSFTVEYILYVYVSPMISDNRNQGLTDVLQMYWRAKLCLGI